MEALAYRPLDLLAAEMANAIATGDEQPTDMPLIHTFTRGMYKRRIFLPAGTKVITKIHNSQHNYVILFGRGAVSLDGENWEAYEGPSEGVTEPGTQRFIIVEEDTVWITYHPNPDNEKDLQKIEDRIMTKYEIPKELLNSKEPIELLQN